MLFFRGFTEQNKFELKQAKTSDSTFNLSYSKFTQSTILPAFLKIQLPSLDDAVFQMYNSAHINGKKTVGLAFYACFFFFFSFKFSKCDIIQHLQRIHIENRINMDLYALVSYLRLCLPGKFCELLKLPLGESIDPLMEALACSGTESKGYDSTKHAVLTRVLSSSA